MSSKISELNKEYFGKDRKKTYLKDDFTTVLRGTVVRSILIELFFELSKARHNTEELPNGGMSFGDFDPDNAGFFANIFDTYQKGWMLSVRQLLTPKERGAGGKFIKDVQKLTADDFIDFYIKPDRASIPPLLLGKAIKENPANGVEFIRNNSDVIEKATNDLISKSKKFQDKGYFNKIMKEYEAIEFHKDNQPEKYDLREEPTDFPFSNGTMTVRSPRSKIAIKEIAECLNNFADIVTTYHSLVGSNTNFIGSNWALDVFIDRTFTLFAKEIPEETKKKVADEVIKYLHESVDIVHWDHRKILKDKSKKA